MKLFRPSRFVTAAITLFSILFMQLAVASYICPALSMEQDQAMSASAQMAESGMSDCHDMDPVEPSLCHAYTQADKQSLDKPPVPELQPFMAVGFWSVSAIKPKYPATAAVPKASYLAHATAPPAAIRNCCFRI